jgi:hypothetical protein
MTCRRDYQAQTRSEVCNAYVFRTDKDVYSYQYTCQISFKGVSPVGKLTSVARISGTELFLRLATAALQAWAPVYQGKAC